MHEQQRTFFDSYHPVLSLCYFGVVIIIIMAAFHPVLLIISFIIGLVYNVYLKGSEGMLKSFRWQIPLLAIIMLVNPLFNRYGSTVLFEWGNGNAYYLEGMLYGLFLGVMLMSMLTWFSNLSAVLSADDIMQIISPRVPTLSMMCVMILRLVPLFIRRGKQVQELSVACTCSGAKRSKGLTESAGHVESCTEPEKGRNRFGEDCTGFKKSRTKSKQKRTGFFRISSVLLGWGMEDSIESALSMQARGWGSSAKRSSYKTCVFRLNDAVALAIVLALSVACALGIIQLMQDFSFYPSLSPITFHWVYLVYLALLFLPAFIKLKAWLLWHN